MPSNKRSWTGAASRSGLNSAGAIGLLRIAVLAAGTWLYLHAEVGRADPNDATQVAQGRAVYEAHCASCHGANLEGQPNWRERQPNGRLLAPPHDVSGHTWHHPDRVLFEITRDGIAAHAPKGCESDMPAFGRSLSDGEIWAVLAYIKSRWPQDIRVRFVAEFIGRSNWFSGVVGPAVSADTRAFRADNGETLTVSTAASGSPGRYDICVRPERIRVVDAGERPETTSGADSRMNILNGTLVDSVPLGSDIHLMVLLGSGQRISVLERSVGQPIPQVGRPVALQFSCESCIVIAAKGRDE